MPDSFSPRATGRIKLGTESNGGFRNITISNCVFERGRGFALDSVDGAICEDITFTGIAMRGMVNSPIFLRLGARMRGPAGRSIGSIKRVLIANVASSGAGQLPSILSGIPGHEIEDIKISDVYLQQKGGGDEAMARIQPPEKENAYPEPTMFGAIPATGFFLRHIKNLEMSNIEIAAAQPDDRPAFALVDVQGADFFRIRVPRPSQTPSFSLRQVTDFRVFGSQFVKDQAVSQADEKTF